MYLERSHLWNLWPPGLFLIILHLFYLHRISFTILQSLLSNLYNKNYQKNLLYYLYQISLLRVTVKRLTTPLSRWLQDSWLFVQVLGDLRVVSYWIETFGSQKLREILTPLCCITLSSSRENQRSAQEVAWENKISYWFPCPWFPTRWILSHYLC